MKQFFNTIRHSYSIIYKVIISIFTVVSIVLMLPREAKFYYEFQLGRPWKYETLIAVNDIPILKNEQDLEREKQEILKSRSYYFSVNQELTKNIQAQAILIFDSLWVKNFGFSDFKAYEIHKSDFLITLSTLLDRGILGELPTEKKFKVDDVVYLVHNQTASKVFFGDFKTKQHIVDSIKLSIKDTNPYTLLIYNSLNKSLKPNLFYDISKTDSESESLLKSLSPYEGVILQGQLIISEGEVVDEHKHRILSSVKAYFDSNTDKSYWIIIFGQTILVIIPVFVFLLWLYFFRRDLYEENKNILLFLVLITFMVFLSRLAINYDSAYLMIVPLAVNILIVRTLYDTRLALIVHLTTVLLVSYFVPNSFQFLFLQVITGIITIVSVVKLFKRSQFFLTAIYVMLSYSVMYVSMVMITTGDLRQVELSHLLYFGLNSFMVLLSYPLIYLLEKLFGMVSDISLLEYADTNNDVLRTLAAKAPGTFQHSVQVANMAEDAIRQIGGNPLLVRAGAMYHDIGKSLNPIYFTENQPGAYNPHDDLSFEESARIIIDHVVEGVELARKHKLPEQIIDFIRTHHGTKMVEYFYRMSLKEKSIDEINLAEFTYPGPIPFNRETCVLMMADAVEAASRSIKDPDERKLSDLVDKIIQSQLDQGQFNNSNITMRDINAVKKLFKRRLMGIYHVRIEYPQ